MPRSKDDEDRLETLVLEIRRTALEFERFGRYVRGERDHPGMEAMAKEFEEIANNLSAASNERGALGRTRYRALATSFEEIGRLIRESSEQEKEL
jgi:hypothetical protein